MRGECMKNTKDTKQKNPVILRQLLTPIVIIIVLLALVLEGLMGGIFYVNYQNRVIRGSQEQTALMADTVSAFLSEAYGLTEELATNPSILSMDTAVQTPILSDCASRNSYLELLYVQDVTGMQTGRSGGELANRSDRWWFKQVTADKKPFISKSYYSVNTGSPCASIFYPMYKDGAFTGVFATDIKLGSLVEKVTEFSNKEKDEVVFIIDGEGTVVAHPDTNYVSELYNYKTNTHTVSVKDSAGNPKKDAEGNIVEEQQPLTVSDSFSKMIGAVMGGAKGNRMVTVDGKDYYASYAPVVLDGESDSWSVVSLQRRANLMMPLYWAMGITIVISLLTLGLAIVLIRASAKRITDPLSRLTEIIRIASEGDFSVKAEVQNENTEIGALAGSFNHMTDKVARVLGETMRLLQDVKGSASTLAEISESTETMANDMDQISLGAQTQSQDTREVADLTAKLQECTESLQQMSTQIKEQTRETRGLSENGLSSVHSLKKKSEDSLEAMKNSYDMVLALNESSRKIGTIVEEINSISSQTELLALNASIEAARAGEAGKGFAVVATEVSTLAANSGNATHSISQIVADLQNEIKEIVNLIDGIKNTFEEQMVSVGEVEEAFSRFKEASDASLGAIENVSGLIDTASEVNQKVVASIDSIHEISTETEENARSTAERVSRQTDDIRSIAKKVENMNQASALLEEEMSRFKI